MENNLTPDQIPLLTDAELNQACAERVMGWEYVHNPGAVKYWRWSEGVVNVCNWSPATSLSDAAKCTERMMARGWRFTAHAGFDENDAPIYCYRMSHFKLGIVATSKWQPSEPRARSSAALLAAGREER